MSKLINTTTVGQAVNYFQSLLDIYDWSTVKNHNQFHNVVQGILNADLEGFTVTLWKAYFGYTYEDVVFTYDRAFEKDNRCKFKDKGEFSKVKISCVEGMENILMSDLDKYFGDVHHKKTVAFLWDKRKKAIAELMDAEDSLKKLGAIPNTEGANG